MINNNNNVDIYAQKNQYMFPHDLTIEDCREATKNVPGFRETNKNGLICFNYDFATRQSFPDPLSAPDHKTSYLLKVRRECRGIIFDKESGQVVCRKFHKFFNINELEETSQDKIVLAGAKYCIMEKLDGSLIAPIYLNQVISWGSKAGHTELSEKVDKFIEKKQAEIKYNDMARYWLERGCTPMFEWCSESQRIVLYYPVDTLSLTAVRSIRTGDYILYDEMVKVAAQFNVPVAKCVDQAALCSESKTAEELLVKVQEMKDIEGYILRFDDGRVYKMKCTWYFNLSKSAPINLTHEKDIWMMILDNKLDDTVSGLCAMGPLPVRYVKIQKFARELFETIEELTHNVINELYTIKQAKRTRKIIHADSQIEPHFKKLLFEFFDEIDVEEDRSIYLSRVSKFIIYHLKSQCGTASKLNHAREMVGGLKGKDE
ncbi:hypothetical protein SAMD00019534_034300 [Acytostelium subglobosum LB1]|uniref:hypothetical protein n=1 Tax=Acytostelium subglobosum LB1 TaxID=1410327 RepID=UPI000644BCDA|nr:hypothetical protein SAMD00019534_034300 [Acytostelium subglobosum LB1]GAM20255.1 hypothetical protein SAMD00019534_034300 [Acytostelium subglobosum LB1]|eukprot:XP_012759776.1 hypothetical protein SAMD00019534_034300 [Acytostelium subglobosum LB1]